MKRRHWPVIALALTAPLLAASVQVASASPAPAAGKNHPAHATRAVSSSKQPNLVQPKVLSHYRVTSSTAFTDPANSQAFGSVSCAVGRAISGGAIISSTSVQENINSSIPTADGKGWDVWVNNTSAANGSFVVYAICAKGIAGYLIVNGGISPDPPGLAESNQLSAVCPTGTVVYGGGGYTTSSSPLTMMAESQPGYETHTWYSAFNNRSATSTNDEAFAVCGRKLAGYVHVHGVSSNDAPGTQAGASVSCPVGDDVLGGGGGPTVFWNGRTDMNSTGPISSTTWSYWENNLNTTQFFGVEASAVCVTAA